MNHTDSPISTASTDLLSAAPVGVTDDWLRRFGVPWERVDRAARAVLDRAAAASRRRFADLSADQISTQANPG